MTTKIVKIDDHYEEIILDQQGRLVEQTDLVDEEGNILPYATTLQYDYVDGKTYSRHRGWSEGCFWTDWEEE
jgi:hypothetical protein